jgi:hypothetical protein
MCCIRVGKVWMQHTPQRGDAFAAQLAPTMHTTRPTPHDTTQKSAATNYNYNYFYYHQSTNTSLCHHHTQCNTCIDNHATIALLPVQPCTNLLTQTFVDDCTTTHPTTP